MNTPNVLSTPETNSPETSNAQAAMPLVDALQILHDARTDQVLITTMGSAREWTRFKPHPLDFLYVPSSMGQAMSLGLGIALAQPERRVIACNGDGSLLMNLGCLVTITAQAPSNLALILFDNGVYEVTGRQATPGASPGRPHSEAVNFCEIARACGFQNAVEFRDLTAWQNGVLDVLNSDGLIFCCLHVAPVAGDTSPKSPGPAAPRAAAFRSALIGIATNSLQ